MTGNMISAKIMILGAVGVGKSSLVKRFVRNRFDEEYKTTIGVEIQNCEITLSDGQCVRLMLWDTDGDFGQRIFDTAYIKGASGALIVSDATRPTTLAKLRELTAACDDRLPGRPMRAVVNKCDLVDPKTIDLAGAGLHHSELLYCSAKSGDGVQALFESIAQDIVRRREPG